MVATLDDVVASLTDLNTKAAATNALLTSIDSRLTTANSTLSLILGQLNAFDQIVLYILFAHAHEHKMTKPVWWDSVVASFGMTLPWPSILGP